jgi:hypothetical protein
MSSRLNWNLIFFLAQLFVVQISPCRIGRQTGPIEGFGYENPMKSEGILLQF